MKPRYTIPFRGLKEGTHTWEWVLDDGFWAAHPEGGITGGRVEVASALKIGAGASSGAGAATKAGTRSESGVMRLDVEMAGSVIVPCDRCLEDCDLPVAWRGELTVKRAQGEQAAEIEANREAAMDGDILWLLPGDGTIDLEQYLYESVVLSLPLQRVHPEDVHGQPLCNPAMLERFKIVTQEEFENLKI